VIPLVQDSSVMSGHSRYRNADIVVVLESKTYLRLVDLEYSGRTVFIEKNEIRHDR